MDFFAEFARSFSPETTGYMFMWVIAGVGAIALTIVVERWWDIGRRSDVNTQDLVPKLITLIREKRLQDAFKLCASGGRRALPRVMGAGVDRAINCPPLIKGAMEEEMLHMVPILERRLPLVAACGNVATLLGLMGTIYGLILSFAAVGQPDVPATQKASMLATGISTAMNTTLLGLIIAVPCVYLYSVLRAKVDESIADIDRYAVSVLKVLLPTDTTQKSYKVSGRRIKQEVDTEPNIVPFMNLMVVLIPLLLSSSEFIKIGMVELKLPESGAGGGGGGQDRKEVKKVDLGVVITGKGFNLFHSFKETEEPEDGQSAAADMREGEPDIPLVDGQYNYQVLTKELAKVKRKALLGILKTVHPNIPEDATLPQLDRAFGKKEFEKLSLYADHENMKIVAEDSTKYQVVVSVMDAARGYRGPAGNISLFPNVSIAGGIAY
jgi:biopolymer transport protein ExbB